MYCQTLYLSISKWSNLGLQYPDGKIAALVKHRTDGTSDRWNIGPRHAALSSAKTFLR